MYPVWSRGGRFYKKQPCEPIPLPRYSIPQFPQGNLPKASPVPSRPVYSQESVSLHSSPGARGRSTPGGRGRGAGPHSHDTGPSSPALPSSPKLATPWEGSMVEFMEKQSVQLAILCEPLDPHGRTWTAKTKDQPKVVLNLNSITFHWPQYYLGQSYHYGMEDLTRLGDLCASLVKSYKNHIKIAWGSYVDRGVSKVTPDMLAGFLFGTFPKPHELYVAHRLLLEEEIYFARAGVDDTSKVSPLTSIPAYRCRMLHEVSKIERERKQKKMYQENLTSFLESASLILNGSEQAERFKDQWKSFPYKLFIDKLAQAALSTCGVEAEVNTDILEPLGINRSPKDVFNLLVSLGVLKKYQNPNVLRYSRSLEMSDAQEEACKRAYVLAVMRHLHAN